MVYLYDAANRAFQLYKKTLRELLSRYLATFFCGKKINFVHHVFVISTNQIN